jgi:hypothetical protein
MATCSVANYQPSLNKSIYDAMAYPKRPSAIQILSEGASSGAREGEQLQAGLTLALERLHKSNGNSLPVHMLPPDTSLHDMDVFGIDLTTLITDLATTVMPHSAGSHTAATRYTPDQRKAAIQRFMFKRSRRHLAARTKYTKMKHVAVNKARCKGGKFMKKADRERMEAEMSTATQEEEVVAAEVVAGVLPESPYLGAVAPIDRKGDPGWVQALAYYAKTEE